MTPTRPLLLALLVVALAGCRLSLDVELDVAADASATAALELGLDAALATELEQLGADPARGVAAQVQQLDGWDVTVTDHDDGAVTARLTRQAAAVADLTAPLRDLQVGLAGDDPALLLDLDVAVGDDGATTVRGAAGLRPPATAGAAIDDEPVGPAGDDLAALVRDTVAARLVITLPGPVEASDADHVDGRTATWELPVGESRPVSADGAPAAPPWRTAVLGGVAAAAVAALGLLLLAWRRRRRGQPGARPEG